MSEIGQRDAKWGALALHMFDLGQHDYLRARAAYQFGSKEPPLSPSVTLRFGVEMGSTGKGGGAPRLWLRAATDARLAAAMSHISLSSYVCLHGVPRGFACVSVRGACMSVRVGGGALSPLLPSYKGKKRRGRSTPERKHADHKNNQTTREANDAFF